eukprot:m.217378 g.217378  ORF g.217378 m.217378 type:complete len:67 (-) comp15557_c1_seq1:4091-4291(-)
MACDGMLASGSCDCTVRVWDCAVADVRIVRTIPTQQYVCSITIGPWGTIVSGYDGDIRLDTPMVTT